MKIMFSTIVSLVALFIIFAVSVPLTSAQATATETTDYQRTSSIYDKTIYRLDNRVIVNDLINGDLYCAGNTVLIDAVINGDVLCMANKVTIKGSIEGDARIIAKDIIINADIGGNATLIASNITIGKGALIANDVSLMAQTITIDGQVGRDVTMRSDTVTLSGRVGRTIESYHYTMILASTTQVGNIDYASPNDLKIEDGAQYGAINTIESSTPSYLSGLVSSTVFIAALLYIAVCISLIITALVIAFMFPKSLDDSAAFAKKQPYITGLAGLLLMFVVPPAIILLVVSVVGIPLAFIVSLLLGVILLLSTPFVAHLIGAYFFPQRSHPVRSLVGSVLLLLLIAIPVINIITITIVTIYGTGLIVRVVYQRYSTAANLYKNRGIAG